MTAILIKYVLVCCCFATHAACREFSKRIPLADLTHCKRIRKDRDGAPFAVYLLACTPCALK
jgi:hypothetical protein